MARRAVTVSVSMSPETRELMDRLRAGLPPSEYIRGLVEEDAARHALSDPQLALAKIVGAQREIPTAWQRDEIPDLLADILKGADVTAVIGAEIEAGDLSREELGPAAR